MASNSKTLTTSRGGRFTLSVNWSESSTNVANNTSVISASGSIGSSSWAWDSNYNSYLRLYWHDNRNNTDVHFATSSAFKSCGVGYGGTRSVSGSITVAHNDDGSLSGYVVCKFEAGSDSGGYSPSSNNVSTSWTALTQIGRASAFGSIIGNTIGERITVNISRSSSSFTHQLWYRLGNSQWYDCGSGIGTSIDITPTLELCRQIPSSAGGTLELSLRTFDGSSRVGSDLYKNIYVKVPDRVRPTEPSITLTRIDNGVPSSFGVYVQSYSKVKATATASGSYGSTITSYTLTCDGASGASGTTFGPFSHGTKTITATATDSRGRSTSSTVPIQVYPYSPPSVSISGVRCDADKTINSAGTHILVTCSWSISSVNYKNSVTSQRVSITPGTATKTIFSNGVPFVLDANLSPSATGTLTAIITDSMGNSATATSNMSTDVRIMNVKANKKGIAFGKFAKLDNIVDFGWQAKFSGGTQGIQYSEVEGKPNLITLANKNGYWGMVAPNASDADWIRTTQLGIIPYQQGGHGNIGSPGWPFLNGHFKQIYINNVPQFEDTGWVNLLPGNPTALIKYRKKNGFVTIVGDSWGGISIPTGTWTTVATLPANCKPAIQIIGMGTPKNSTGYEVQFNINTNGAVTLYNLHPNTATTYWAFTVTYPV